MPITIPYSFVSGTTILSAEVNSNFTTLGGAALNRAGDTITGNIAVNAGVTIDGVDISAYLTSTQLLAPVVGSAATPAVALATDTDTGLYFSGANQLAWSLGGTKKLELTSTGLTVTNALAATGGITVASLLNGVTTVISNAATGAQNNFAPAGMSGNTLITLSDTTGAQFTGLAGTVTGQIVIFKVADTGGVFTFAHNSGSSTSGNRFFLPAQSAATPISKNGWIAFINNGSFLVVIGHEQGAWITPAYSAGDFDGNGSQTWTVGSGDVATMAYRLAGRTLQVVAAISTSTVGGGANTQLRIHQRQWGTFTPTKTAGSLNSGNDNGTKTTVATSVAASGTQILIERADGANWAAATDATAVNVMMNFEVT